MTVNQKIRILRKERNMTIASLAAQIGIYQSLLTRYETGVIQYVPMDLIHKIADVFSCSVSDLIDGDERYSQKKKRRSSQTISSEEYELIKNYRNLPSEIQSLIKDMCSLHISIDN